MKTGFAHFDNSHRENFGAAVLLLVMEIDEAVENLIANLVRTELEISSASRLLSFGREARLEKGDEDKCARVDLWLLFDSPGGPVYAFVEVKTHTYWDPVHVAHQVRDQAARNIARRAGRIVGSVLLAPGNRPG